MRTPLSTLTLTLVLSLPAMASADVYKCPAPGGTTVYQDAPCGADAQDDTFPRNTQTGSDPGDSDTHWTTHTPPGHQQRIDAAMVLSPHRP